MAMESADTIQEIPLRTLGDIMGNHSVDMKKGEKL
jgi:hypothetical protein